MAHIPYDEDEWNKIKRGDTVKSKVGEFAWVIFVKYLGECKFDSDCFIGQDEDGFVEDDWIKGQFEPYDA